MLLPKLYYCHNGSIKKPSKKNLVKKTNQKELVKMVESKSTCPKRYFGQVGHGGKKNHMGSFLDQNSHSKKLGFIVVHA